MEVFREFTIEAAHRLPNLPADHKCARLHGHSFRIEVHVRGPIGNVTGWVVDFADIDGAFRPLFDALDHHYLNEIDGLENPTSEHLAMWIWTRLRPALPSLFRVVVRETCTSGCSYAPELGARLSSGHAMTAAEFRKLALSLPDTSEGAHMGHPDFRVAGKIFATLGYPGRGWAMVQLTPVQQEELVESDPAFVPVPGGWGRKGSTNVKLAAAKKGAVRDALEMAWRNRAPKRSAKGKRAR